VIGCHIILLDLCFHRNGISLIRASLCVLQNSHWEIFTYLNERFTLIV